MTLVQELPLWAVIDSFSIGTLGKFIMQCGTRPEDSQEVWKHIAHELSISNSKFSIVTDSFGVTRNLIFHQQRLWMRPMPKSPGIPKIFESRYRDRHFKKQNKEAHFIALLSVAQFLPKADQSVYLSQLEKVVTANHRFELGIMRSPFPLKNKVEKTIAKPLPTETPS